MHSTAWRSAARRSMLVIGLAGGFTVLGAGIAASTATADEQVPVVGVATAGTAAAGDDENDENDETSGEDGIGSGNQVEADADAPVDASDNQVTVVGDGNQSEGGGSEPQNGVEPDADADHTSGDDGVLSGNQVEAEAEAPVQLTGNQVTVVGDDNTSGGSTSGACQDESSSSGDTTNGDDGVLSGNQVDVDVDAPVDASGNQVTVIGDENTSGGSGAGDCGAADGSGGGSGGDASGDDSGSEGSGDVTSGEDGAGSGNQLTLAPVVPVDASGNQVTVVGDGNESGGSTGGGSGGDASGGDSGSEGSGDVTSGEDGAGSGNQLTLAPFAPVDASGNQVTVVGDGNESGGSTGGDEPGGSEDGDTTSGEGGTGSGNQLTLDPVARVDADENQLTVLGNDNQSGTPEDGDDGTSGSGNPDGDGDGGTDGAGGPDGDGDRDQAPGNAGGFGGPGRPGAAVLGPLPTDAGPATGALPQTGATTGPGLGLLGLVMILAGLALTTRRRGVVRS